MNDQQQVKKRMWKPEEDLILKRYVELHGEGNWSAISKKLGLRRGGKSCRLRWKNYLRPDIKHGSMSKDEEDLIIRMHKLIGNRWSLIAGRLPGRTDNEVKNYWNTYLSKKVTTQGSKRKLSYQNTELELEDEKHENEHKRAKTTMLETSGDDHITQDLDTNTKEDIMMMKQVESKGIDDKFWMSSSTTTTHDLTTSEMLVGSGSGAGNLSFGMMDMSFMDYANPFMVFGGNFDQQESWDHGNCVLFDTFGTNWPAC